MIGDGHRVESARREYKFLVDESIAARLRRHLAPYADPDDHTTDRAGYPISSLYFDTTALRFARETVEGECDRVKLRVRRYQPIGGDPAAPMFFEIKRKSNGVVLKSRAAVPAEIGLGLLEDDRAWIGRVDGPARRTVERFFDLVTHLGARPVVNVHYRREAYRGRFGDSSRVTFDRELRATLPSRRGVFGAGAGLPTSLRKTVLEVKFNGGCPAWVSDMIRRFDLCRRPVPKYVLCLSAARAMGVETDVRVRRAGATV